MELKFIYFLALPVLVCARGFKCNIKSSPDVSDFTITVDGTATSAIDDNDKKVFKLSDNEIKDAIKTVIDQRPKDVFLKDPTPFGTFSEHNYREAQKTTSVLQAFFVGFNAVPVVLATQRLRNTSSKKGTFKSALSAIVKTSASVTKTAGKTITVGTTVDFNINIVSKNSLEFSSTWGEETTESIVRKLSSPSPVATDLEPGESVVVTLKASRGTAKYQVEFITRLIGQVWCNFKPNFQGVQFKAYPVDDILAVTRAPKFVRSIQIIETAFYFDSDVKLGKIEKEQ